MWVVRSELNENARRPEYNRGASRPVLRKRDRRGQAQGIPAAAPFGRRQDLVRLLVEALIVWRAEESALRVEVLALRRQAQVLERQIKRVHRTPCDRMALAVLTRRLPKASWPGLLVKLETVFGKTRALFERHRDLRLGLADASLVVLGERYKTTRILTFDAPALRAVTPLQGGSFALLPA